MTFRIGDRVRLRCTAQHGTVVAVFLRTHGLTARVEWDEDDRKGDYSDLLFGSIERITVLDELADA